MRILKAALVLAAIMLAVPAQAVVEPVNQAEWEALLRKYDRSGEHGETVPEPPISDDEAVLSGLWDDLARKYDNIYAASDAVPPSPETLASWWNVFGDETLTRLVLSALADNRDLRAVRGRVLEARAALGISKSARLPWLDNTDSWTKTKSSEHSTGDGARTEVTKLSIDASWEIDIFGGRRDAISASEADLEASHAALHAAWVTLSSEVALNYLSLRTLQERLRIANLNLTLQEDTLSMLASQYEAGLRDSLALNQALYTVENTRASIPTLKASIEGIMNALALLAGRVPGSLENELANPRPLPEPASVNLVGIPADAVRQRPDIREAERALAAQISRRKSAEKDLLPKFYLMGSIGLETLAGGSLFSGDSVGFSFGPRITLPIFHGGAIRKNIQAQSAREEQLLASYEGSVLGAVAEVRNALASSTQEIDRNKYLRNGIEAAKAALAVADDKYRNGLTDFSNVINAQVALLSLQDQITISDGQMASNVVRIFKALGGGWAPMAEENSELRIE